MECCISCDCPLLVAGVLASLFLHLVSAAGFRASGLCCWVDHWPCLFPPCGHSFPVATAFWNCPQHGLSIGSNSNWQGSERRAAANATAGCRLGGRGCRLPSNHLVRLQSCDAWCRCQSSVHYGREVLQHGSVNTFGRLDSLVWYILICFPQRVRWGFLNSIPLLLSSSVPWQGRRSLCPPHTSALRIRGILE